jgi:hypothetical protein
MDNGEPLPSYEGLAAAFAKAKAEKEKEEASGLRATTGDAEVANKQGEVHFKAAHGILVAFFTLILYIIFFRRPCVVTNGPQCTTCSGHIPLHERLPPYEISTGP